MMFSMDTTMLHGFVLFLVLNLYNVPFAGAFEYEYISAIPSDLEKHHHHGSDFTSPSDLFVQERASKQLPGPGQHFSFGAVKPWEEIHAEMPEGSKLLLLIRHGEAVSNWLSSTLGPDEWYAAESKCDYKSDDGYIYDIFDAELTTLGQEQAWSLNDILGGGQWFSKLTNGKPAAGVVSPLSRCLNTAEIVRKGLHIPNFHVEELARETLGSDTCDARRSASDAADDKDVEGPCTFELGLRSKFPNFTFPIHPEDGAVDALGGKSKYQRKLGLISDADEMWTKEREKQAHQVKRANNFLHLLFLNVQEDVVFVVTHSGFTRSVLLAVDREPYRPQNAELVPVIIVPKKKATEAQS